MPEAKNYDDFIIEAANKLNEVYYLFGAEPDEKYDMFRKGFIMAVSTAYGLEPISVSMEIDNVEE